MKARRLPGVRCSTLKTECRSLLCLMIMPGRSWVAGIDIARKTLLECDCGLTPAEGGQPTISAATRAKVLFYTQLRPKRKPSLRPIHRRQAGWAHFSIGPPGLQVGNRMVRTTMEVVPIFF